MDHHRLEQIIMQWSIRLCVQLILTHNPQIHANRHTPHVPRVPSGWSAIGICSNWCVCSSACSWDRAPVLNASAYQCRRAYFVRSHRHNHYTPPPERRCVLAQCCENITCRPRSFARAARNSCYGTRVFFNCYTFCVVLPKPVLRCQLRACMLETLEHKHRRIQARHLSVDLWRHTNCSMPIWVCIVFAQMKPVG